ncbi:GNAT family N-acetyltransferase [Arthrobacter sp. KBS0703]|uniref:GNAT family N-acetyltransferase n=1 Tax=Arthrobacter sp. KBS0703 TaxID=1955698 RepID=UPI00098F3940|nr:GNAT family N-acetyltransferase [Arthrobacter sp. KBS0703]TSE14547.1 GNAT family N-acetyltransferase [Arthrobacter sp. KBS0703]
MLHSLVGDVGVRLLHSSDADAQAAAYRRNREHLAPWEPVRPEDFFTVAGQHQEIETRLAQYDSGLSVPWALVDGSGRIVGNITLSRIVRGPLLSAHLGYWVDREVNGRGIASAAVAFALPSARDGYGLHRVQAGTLVHNAASQKVLARAGFEKIGHAASYLRIAGRWQDHILFQRILD